MPKVSVIVNNYNYARFLGAAIDSALAQTYAPTEIIVVDDGSTDTSRELISSYRSRIVPLLKQNAGQASALNAGFARSTGDIVQFLDSDDLLLPCAVELFVAAFSGPPVVKVHWPLAVIDGTGRRTGALVPPGPLPSGDLRTLVMDQGPDAVTSSPTSGNAWSRRYLERVMPIPESTYRLCADDYLYSLAPFVGEIGKVDIPLGEYRLHGANNHSAMTFDQRIDYDLLRRSTLNQTIETALGRLGICVDTTGWFPLGSWLERLHSARRAIATAVAPAARFILLDDEQWNAGREILGRQRVPFLERNGVYWGAPSDSSHAIAELERLRESGASAIVVAWPSFWWLEQYPDFAQYLVDRYQRVTADDNVVIFRLVEMDR